MTNPRRGRPAGEPTFAEQVEAAGGDSVVFARIAAGETVGAIMASYDRDRDQFYVWIRAGGEERRQVWEDAKKASADALVETGLEIIDDTSAGESTARVQLARARAEYRRWLASCRNRDEYGERAGPTVQVSIQQLHLDALRKLGSMEFFPPAPRQINGSSVAVEE